MSHNSLLLEHFEQLFIDYRDQANALVCENQIHEQEIEHLELQIRQKQRLIKDNVSKHNKLITNRNLLFKNLLQKGELSTIVQLLDKGYTLPPEFDYWSIEYGSVDGLDLAMTKNGKHNNTALMERAIQRDQLDCVIYLLLNYINIKQWDSSEGVLDYYGDNREKRWFNKWTRCAAQYKSHQVLKLLVEEGCGVEEGVLLNSVESGSFECLEYAYSKGARFSWHYVDNTCHEYGHYALLEAARQHDLRILMFLVEVARCGIRNIIDLPEDDDQDEPISELSLNSLEGVTDTAIWFAPEVFLATTEKPSPEAMRYLWGLRDRYGGIEWSTEYSGMIANSGRLDLLKEIIDLGCPISSEAVVSAITNDTCVILEFLWNETDLLKREPDLFTDKKVKQAIYSSLQENLYDCNKFIFTHVYGPWDKDLYDHFNSRVDLDDPFWRWFLFDQPAVTDPDLIEEIENKQWEIEETKDKLNVLHQEKLVIKDIIVYDICPYI